MTAIKSLSLACRVVMDLHALNNEGNESNRLMTRQVGIVTRSEDENGEPIYRRDKVNAISGDMNKHIFADAYRNIALDLGLPMNKASQALDPARMMGDPDFEAWITAEKRDVDVVIDALLTCALTDVCGIMITAGGNSVKRKSAVEFGWTVGLPQITQVEEFIHARHAITRVERTRLEDDATKEDREKLSKERGANLGQMIFNRPASSGVYAFVANLDVSAIGFNDAAQYYPEMIGDTPINRPDRMRAALLALAQTVLHPKGALTSTQLPHVVDVEGFVSLSTSAAAAPMISPLDADYLARVERVSGLLNRLHGTDAVQVLPFQGGEGLLERMVQVVEGYEPGRYTRTF